MTCFEFDGVGHVSGGFDGGRHVGNCGDVTPGKLYLDIGK